MDKVKSRVFAINSFFDKCKKKFHTIEDNEEQIKAWCELAVHDHLILPGYDLSLDNHDTLATLYCTHVDGGQRIKITILLKKGLPDGRRELQREKDRLLSVENEPESN